MRQLTLVRSHKGIEGLARLPTARRSKFEIIPGEPQDFRVKTCSKDVYHLLILLLNTSKVKVQNN